ncbi:AGE family epimerase/isomerase [Streptosporangium sp. NPDC001559]|uniref:AGE family epimerase/isomerase n=1 Tax=Streptosporangium sp. NPDC001559 TaxID=3366187 RepID=UPI0036E0FBBB
MSTGPDFAFSDLVAGYVRSFHDGRVALRTFDGRSVTVHLTGTTSGQIVRNLGRSYQDVSGRLWDLLVPGQMLFSYGPVYPEANGPRFQASQLFFLGERPDEYGFETPDWWIDQLGELAAFYRGAQFGAGPVDFADYRTELRLGGEKTGRHVQETDTLSRLVYGMASAYMLSGEEDFLTVAQRGSRYLRDHMRFVDPDAGVTYWYHGVDLSGARERKLFSSEFGDDYRAIPAYEQIYALVGLTQTYRVTGDPDLRADIEDTVTLFERFFSDRRLGGYFSHLDPETLSPHHESLGGNRSRKNWNSVGDHAPAYLINLYLATGEQRYLSMLEHTFDMIVSHFPDPDGLPFVRERFHHDWTPDATWGWQRDRAVVGHNLKIAWNLTRMNAVLPKFQYRELAERIAKTMPEVARDRNRGGWYDMLERRPDQEGVHRFVWHDRKSWWQQEQAILAYLILAGHTGDDDYLRHARESAAFYNAFFLDHDQGGVHFTVLAGGVPFLMGDERLKGSHSMSMYHTSELCYLAAVYGRLLVRGEPLSLWFRPHGRAGYPGGLLRVAPDLLPRGRVLLDEVSIDGRSWPEFDPEGMTVTLPDSGEPMTVQVRLTPRPR